MVSRTLEALEDAMDACRTMAGWTDSAVRAYDYQEAEAALRALKEALIGWKRGRGIVFEDANHCDECRLAALLSAPASPTGGEENDGA